MKANLLREKVTEVGMFQPFCFNHIITDLSFIYIYIYIYIYRLYIYIYIYIYIYRLYIYIYIYIYIYYKAGLTKFQAIEHKLTRMRACEQLQKFLEYEKASTRVIFASNSSKGQIL